MSDFDLVIHARHTITPTGERPAAMAVIGQTIAAIRRDVRGRRGALWHRDPITPYAGRTLTGVVRGSWLGGQELIGDGTRGCLLVRAGA